MTNGISSRTNESAEEIIQRRNAADKVESTELNGVKESIS